MGGREFFKSLRYFILYFLVAFVYAFIILWFGSENYLFNLHTSILSILPLIITLIPNFYWIIQEKSRITLRVLLTLLITLGVLAVYYLIFIPNQSGGQFVTMEQTGFAVLGFLIQSGTIILISILFIVTFKWGYSKNKKILNWILIIALLTGVAYILIISVANGGCLPSNEHCFAINAIKKGYMQICEKAYLPNQCYNYYAYYLVCKGEPISCETGGWEVYNCNLWKERIKTEPSFCDQLKKEGLL